MTVNYYLSMELPIRDGETVLITGPTLSGRRRLLHQLLHTAPGESAVISTREPAGTVRSRYQRRTDGDGSDLIVVDCITNALERAATDTEMTKYAQSPDNLTSIGMKFADILQQHRSDQFSVGVVNLSPLLVYTSPRDVFQFTNILTQKSTGADWPVYAAIEPRVHDTSTVHQFIPLFDTVIETRRTNSGDQELRVKKPSLTDWETL